MAAAFRALKKILMIEFEIGIHSEFIPIYILVLSGKIIYLKRILVLLLRKNFL